MKFFRSTQSVELLQAAMEKTRRGASVFSAFKMVWVYFVSLGAQVRKTPSWPRSWANFSLF